MFTNMVRPIKLRSKSKIMPFATDIRSHLGSKRANALSDHTAILRQLSAHYAQTSVAAWQRPDQEALTAAD
ncbi:hypothetical protein ACC817_34610 [Rhizobium ruizarguesonis]|uniref:hypothetical protein n=1 Tax=Rhizobium ruizarguesonis TaxID=2081791 RepID=UPI001031391E|nr:hypothetical protein [Rhizobium ruizarguesonis]TAY74337.1 hypothetical protein ELH84_10865 [Rhizobium ruizarguesonis]